MKWLLVMYVVGTHDLAYTWNPYPTREQCEMEGQIQMLAWKDEPRIYPVCKPVGGPP